MSTPETTRPSPAHTSRTGAAQGAPKTTVIVGGVAGGMSAAARLRRLDEQMRIIVLEASAHVSFANCGLPYYVGGIIKDRSDLLLQTPESLKARFNLDVRVNTRATSIDRQAQTVTTRGELTGETEQIHYDYLVLAPGANAVIPPIVGIERALTLRNVADVDRIMAALDRLTEMFHAKAQTPSAVLIGGGFIGLELAENLTKRGLAVTVVEATDQIMAPLDPEMAQIVTDHLQANGVQVLTGSGVTQVNANSVTLANGQQIPADLVVAAVGVRPNDTLAREAGLDLGERGGIRVDDQMRTSDPHIFAVGDAVVKKDFVDGADTLVPLAQTANRHGRLVADVIAGRDVHAKRTLGTSIVGLFGLAAGVTGWNEKRARANGRRPRIVHLHPDHHAGYYPGATPLHMKLVVDAETDAILGAQVVGENGVDKRIDVIATAMMGGLKAADLADLELAYAPQFGSAKDPVNLAGYIDTNIIAGQQTAQFSQAEQMVADGWTPVDVRSRGEYAGGTVADAINIPVDQLRERIGELEDAEKVLVICQVGVRGNVATQMLSQMGKAAANLDGGYLTWGWGTETASADVLTSVAETGSAGDSAEVPGNSGAVQQAGDRSLEDGPDDSDAQRLGGR